jgi:4-hydroxy-tetrahydrodipicolinate synthase
MKNALFTGVCTALVTPFLDGRVNYPMMELLLKRQIDAGISAVVVCGTTGESATLSDEEKVIEVTRLIGGEVNDATAIAHAKNMIMHANEYKTI